MITADSSSSNLLVANINYGVIQMRGKTAEKAGADSGSNLVLKMNVKNGGLNHVVADE